MKVCLASLFLTVAAASKKPNVVIIFADDMGYADTSHSGNPTIMTPNLDKFAAEGMRFTQWYSAFHVCSPSRAAMLTGRIPVRSGCAGNGWTGGVFTDDAVGGLPLNETTFAEILGPQGYATMAIGKWHLGQQAKFLPTAQGFDEYFGIPFSVDMGHSPWYTPNRPTVLPLMHNTSIIEQPVDLNTLDERYAAKAVDFFARNAESETPFLLYFACNHVHIPDYASPQFCNTSKRGRFGDAMAEMDNSIGVLMDGLKTAGVDDNTVVFFTSDNGPWISQKQRGGSAGPFFEGKQTTWEGGIREPAMVRWPGKVPAGTISTELAATQDIFATIVSMAGAELPSDRVIDGKDLSGVLLRNEASPHDCLFQYKGVPSTGLPPAKDDPQPGLWAIRCGAYKAHYATSCSIMHTFGDSRCSTELGSEEDRVGGEVGTQTSKPILHTPPLLYNVEHDLGEQYPIDPESDEYASAMATIEAAKQEHEATLSPVPNQMGLGKDEDTVVCCDPDSQSKYPQYMNCTCNPENFDEVFVCAPVAPPTADFKYSFSSQLV